MKKFREQFEKEKGFTYWTEGCNYGSFNDDYVNWLEKKLALILPDVSKSVVCDLCGNTGYLISENGDIGEDCYKCDK